MRTRYIREKIECINFILILASCAIAYIIPWQLLLLAYAVLGPLHYLTQISWMHDRQYFMQGKFDYIYLLGLTFLALLSSLFMMTHLNLLLLVLMLMLSGIFAFCRSIRWRIFFILFSISFSIISIENISNKYWLLFLLLLPTWIHVYVFTAVFMLNGALKQKSFLGLLSFFILLTCGISFFIFSPVVATEHSNFVQQNMKYFKEIATQIIQNLGLRDTDQQMLKIIRFTAFAYTYHYLNWFIKTKVIGWANISIQRSFLIIGLYILFISLYFYNYRVGFAAVLMLSFTHVVLEFPLDILMIKNIIGASINFKF